jgi:Right handed beta helix region/Pectate lyase superfamily protein
VSAVPVDEFLRKDGRWAPPPGGIDQDALAEEVSDPTTPYGAALNNRFPRRGQSWDPIDFGANGDGVTDDTAALQACLNACAADGGGDVVLRARAYKTTRTLVVPEYVRLRGAWSRRYTGNPTTGSRIVAAGSTLTGGGAAAAVVDLTRGSAMQHVSIIGAGKGASPEYDGLRIVNGLVTIEHVTVAGCRNGINVNYKSVNEIVACQLHDNAGYAIVDPVDSKIARCFINVNNGGGIRLSAGANDNAIYDNKIEWNGTASGGNGINATGAVNNKIALNVFDRNASAAMRFTGGCTHTTVSANIFRRNGRYGGNLGTEADVHIWMQGCSSFVFTGNIYRTGSDDNGAGGYTSPAYAFAGMTNTDCDFTSQETAAGGVTGVFNFTGTNTGMRFAGNSGVLDSTTGVVTLAALGSSTIAAATAWTSAPVRIASTAMSTSNPGRLVSLEVWARSTSGGATRHVATCVAIVGREGGSAFISLGAITNHVGTAWALTGGTHNLSATVSADGRDATFSVANDSAASQQYRLVLK